MSTKASEFLTWLVIPPKTGQGDEGKKRKKTRKKQENNARIENKKKKERKKEKRKETVRRPDSQPSHRFVEVPEIEMRQAPHNDIRMGQSCLVLAGSSTPHPPGAAAARRQVCPGRLACVLEGGVLDMRGNLACSPPTALAWPPEHQKTRLCTHLARSTAKFGLQHDPFTISSCTQRRVVDGEFPCNARSHSNNLAMPSIPE